MIFFHFYLVYGDMRVCGDVFFLLFSAAQFPKTVQTHSI